MRGWGVSYLNFPITTGDAGRGNMLPKGSLISGCGGHGLNMRSSAVPLMEPRDIIDEELLSQDGKGECQSEMKENCASLGWRIEGTNPLSARKSYRERTEGGGWPPVGSPPCALEHRFHYVQAVWIYCKILRMLPRRLSGNGAGVRWTCHQPVDEDYMHEW